MQRFGLLLLILNCAACSTMSYKNKTLSYMAAGFATGAVAGVSTAHEDDNKNMHGLLWGSVAAAAVGAIMTYNYDENTEIKHREAQVRELEARLSDFKRNSTTVAKDGETTFMEAKLPKGLRHLVQPGKWKHYGIDEWKKIGDGEYVHQDQLLEVVPAKVIIEQ